MKKLLTLLFAVMSLDSFAQKVIESDTIPMTLNKYNTIYVKAIFNKIDTLNLNFDTGTTELILTNGVLKNKLKSKPELYDTFYNLKIGKSNYSTKVYDAVLTGQETDGRFGWDLFKGKVVELNYDKGIMIVHSDLPKNVANNSKFVNLKLDFYEELPLVKVKIKEGKITNEDWFLFDSGYQRTLMLDNDMLSENKFPTEKMRVIKKVIMRGAQGNEVPVVTSNLELLKIGKFKLKNVPVQITSGNKPLKGKNIHIVGNEVLKRFNLVLDLKENVVYLSKNKLFEVEYIEQKKSGS